MAKLFPNRQHFENYKDIDTYGITKVTIVSATTDHVKLPTMVDARILSNTYGETLPTFYITGNNSTQVNIDGDTVGTERIIVSRHQGRINFAPETGTG